MVTEEQVRQELKELVVPGLTRTVDSMNLIQEVEISEGKVSITIASAGMTPIVQGVLRAKITKVVEKLEKGSEVEVEFVNVRPETLNKIKNVVAVMSGKGGVGKSLVAGLTAVSLKRMGYNVGILDADITGPSVPKMFGISERPAGDETGILPVLTKSGIRVMSVNLLLSAEDDAVIWRGPLIGKAIEQFWHDVHWGDLDYLIIDLPPGTSDAALTVMQTIPITGAVVVYTPQDLAMMIVRKAFSMAKSMDKPVLGVVENMSYIYIPELDKKVELFGASQADNMVKAAGAPLLAKIPVDPGLAKLCDEGRIEDYEVEFIKNLGENIIKSIADTKAAKKKEKETK
ncbi:MAG: Mrp/NBP35 family ATP-binding protein [Dehalococcoidales bacterium]|nr:Mrp/NBP35 family ATP-binding protein [Dehalococcoidales bacterium]